jgi:hypothetical protein
MWPVKVEEEMKTSKNHLRMFIAILGLAALACSELTVVNNTDVAMRVVIKLPEGKGVDTQVIQHGSSETYYSDIEGPYSVSAMLDEEAREFMIKLKTRIQEILTDPKKLSYTDEKLSTLNNSVIVIDKWLVNNQEVSCGGVLSEDKLTIATISFNEDTSKFVISCP